METPLRKLRILEIGTLESAGMAGMLLSDLGAEVIRIDAQPLDGAETVQSVEDAVTFASRPVETASVTGGKSGCRWI